MDFVTPQPLISSILQDPVDALVDALTLKMAALGGDGA